MGLIMHKGVAYGGGIGAISEASDVDLTSPADGQFLKYDGTADKWVNAPISAVYHAAGSKTVEQLLPALLIADNEGCVYNMSNSGETTSDFVEGEGLPIREGDNVGIVNVGTVSNPVYKFDMLSGFVDLSDYYDSDTVDELLDDKADTDSLGDLAAIDKDGASSTKYLQGDGTWQTFPTIPSNDKVKQTNTTTASDYRVLFSGSANNTTTTEGARKSGNLTYNPSTKYLSNSSGGVFASLYDLKSGDYHARLQATSGMTESKTLYLPNEDGTIATQEYLADKLSWKKLYNDEIVPTSTTTSYTPTVALDSDNIHEVYVSFIYGTNYTQRLSITIEGSLFLANKAFPDFYFAGSRLYFAVYPSTGKIVVNQAGSSGSFSWSSTACRILLYYK